MRSQNIAANSRLKREVIHGALWLGLCLLGGSTLVLATYLTVGDQISSFICNTHARYSGNQDKF